MLFFTNGDSRDANLWSNVPYCFARALEEANVHVVRVDYSMPRWFVRCYDLVFRRVMDVLTFRKLRFPYLRCTRWFKWYAERKIKTAINENPQTDLCLFMGYGFYNKWDKTPSLLFSDWTTEMDIRKSREPNFLNRRIIKQEGEAICRADYVVSLFPVCCEKMKQKYPQANIHYLGGNVINNLYEGDINREELLKKNASSRQLLFIGRRTTYLRAAKVLIEAFSQLQQESQYGDLQLDIVGIGAESFGTLPQGVTCHGFLNKSEERDCKQYYKLLMDAKILINANPGWGAFSSTVEAMYFYTPVIVSPYKDFVAEFGNDISFGIYNQNFTPTGIANDIKRILESSAYPKMCEAAHEVVKDFTWGNYVSKILNLVKS